MNLQDKLMKFDAEVHTGVNRQDQKDFPLAAHIGGHFKAISRR